MSYGETLDTLRQQEYMQRLLVQKLQRELYQQPDPAASQTLLDQLVSAESQLAEIEQQRAQAQEADEQSGLILNTGGYDGGLLLGAETTQLEVTVHLRMAQVPTAYHHLLNGEKNPLLSCQVMNTSNHTRRVRVTSFIEGYSAQAVDSFEIEADDSYSFDQLPHLFRDRTEKLNELTRAMLNVLVEDLDSQKVEIHKSYPIWLLAKTTAPLYVQDPTTGQWQDITSYLGAFVTPNAPVIMSFLRQAIDYHPQRQFVGYQINETAVEPQVEALFNALKNVPDIRYVNSVITFTPEQGAFSQRVRLPKESLEHREANCIDGAVLVASLLEAISLSPGIVLVPGHAFVAWETWKGNDQWRYLETTMIGSHTFQEACKSADAQAAKWQKAKVPAGGLPRFRLWRLRQLRSELNILPME
jgi:hypothetical protein